MAKNSLVLPIYFLKGLLICTVLVFVVVNFMEYKDALSLIEVIYVTFSLFAIPKSKIDSFARIVISIAFLLLTFIMLYYLSALKCYDFSIVLLLFFFPPYWLIMTYIGNYFSKKIDLKSIQMINPKNIGAAKEKITALDIWYSGIGFISAAIWFIVISKL